MYISPQEADDQYVTFSILSFFFFFFLTNFGQITAPTQFPKALFGCWRDRTNELHKPTGLNVWRILYLS